MHLYRPPAARLTATPIRADTFYMLPGQSLNQGCEDCITRYDSAYPQTVAVKQYSTQTHSASKLCARETYFLQKIKDSGSAAKVYFVQIYPQLYFTTQPHLTMEFVHGNLYQLKKFGMDNLPPMGLSEGFIWFVFYQLLGALHFLRTGDPGLSGNEAPRSWKPIVHRNLKPENVLLRSNYTIAISNFDSAYENDRYGNYECTSDELCGTPYWMSPEHALQHTNAGFTTSCDSDTWSVGAIVHWLALFRTPIAHALDIDKPEDVHDDDFYLCAPRAVTFIDGPSTGTLEASGTRLSQCQFPNVLSNDKFFSPALNVKMLQCLANSPDRRAQPHKLLSTWPPDMAEKPTPLMCTQLNRPSPKHEYTRERDVAGYDDFGSKTIEWVHEPLRGREWPHRFQTLETCTWNHDAYQKLEMRKEAQAAVWRREGRRHSLGEWEVYKGGGRGNMNLRYGLMDNEFVSCRLEEDMERQEGRVRGYKGRWRYPNWFGDRVEPWLDRDEVDAEALVEQHPKGNMALPKVGDGVMETKEWEKGFTRPWPSAAGERSILHWFRSGPRDPYPYVVPEDSNPQAHSDVDMAEADGELEDDGGSVTSTSTETSNELKDATDVAAPRSRSSTFSEGPMTVHPMTEPFPPYQENPEWDFTQSNNLPDRDWRPNNSEPNQQPTQTDVSEAPADSLDSSPCVSDAKRLSRKTINSIYKAVQALLCMSDAGKASTTSSMQLRSLPGHSQHSSDTPPAPGQTPERRLSSPVLVAPPSTPTRRKSQPPRPAPAESSSQPDRHGTTTPTPTIPRFAFLPPPPETPTPTMRNPIDTVAPAARTELKTPDLPTFDWPFSVPPLGTSPPNDKRSTTPPSPQPGPSTRVREQGTGTRTTPSSQRSSKPKTDTSSSSRRFSKLLPRWAQSLVRRKGDTRKTRGTAQERPKGIKDVMRKLVGRKKKKNFEAPQHELSLALEGGKLFATSSSSSPGSTREQDLVAREGGAGRWAHGAGRGEEWRERVRRQLDSL